MNWLWLVSYFFGGVFAANAIPHFVPHHGTPLSKSLRKAAGQRAFLGNGECCLGIF